MMKARKRFRSLMVSAAVLGMMGSTAVSTATSVLAANSKDDTISVTIHKKNALNYNKEINNDGKEVAADSEIGKLPGLVGAEFTIYDVSESFYGMYLSGDLKGDGEAIMKEITDNIKEYTSKSPVVASGETGDGGKLTKTLNKVSGDAERPAIYAIVETKTVDGMPPAQPIVFSTSVKDKDGQTMDNIHLYPKNYGLDKVMIDDEGNAVSEGADDFVDVAIGDTVKYQVQFAVPYDIDTTAYTNLILTDTLVGADYVPGSMKISSGSTELDGVLKPTPGTNLVIGGSNNQVFALTYDVTDNAVLQALTPYKGKTLTVEYSVKVTSDLLVDQPEKNGAKLQINTPNFNSEQDDDSTPIITGGLQAIKVGTSDESNPLPGAEFALYKLEDGKKLYASFDKAALPNAEVTWSEESTSRLESDKDGKVAISGLDYGTYYLEETKAPDDYVLPEGDDRITEFKVEKGTFTSGIKYIKNVPQADGSLPLTGGIGVMTLLVVGGTLMVLTTVRKKKED